MKEISGATTKRLTLVSAPAGYGKTTLSAQFATQSPYPVVWHSITEQQRDLPTLQAEALSALEHVIADVQSLPPVKGYSPNELASQITQLLRDHLTEPIIYILDDVHFLVGYPAETWLRTLVELAPPACHLILSGRIIPDLPITQMIARRQALLIAQKQLQLTPSEIRAFAKLTPGSDPTEDMLRRLTTNLNGWPAGIALALQPAASEELLVGEGGPEALFMTMARTLLDAQPPDLQNFLLASSTVQRMTPETISSALQLENGAAWLADVQTRNLLLTRTVGGLEYHPLFRTILQEELRTRQPKRYTHLHKLAARWFEAHSFTDEAFDHYIKANLVEQAAAIADLAAATYLIQGKSETMLRWGEILRDRASAPRLFHRCAWVYTDRYQYDRAEDFLQRIELEPGDTILETEVRYQYAFIRLQRGEYETAARLAKELMADTHESTIMYGRALRLLGDAQVHLGEFKSAVSSLEEALPIFRVDGDSYALASLLMTVEVAYSRLGETAKDVECLREVVALHRGMGETGALALALNNLGYHLHLQGNYEGANAVFQEGLGIAARVADARAQGYLLWSLGDLERDRGAFGVALRHYTNALEFAKGEPGLHAWVLIANSTLWRWEGDLSRAALLADEAFKLADKLGLGQEALMARAAQLAVQAVVGDADEALEGLQTIRRMLVERENRLKLSQLLGLVAHAAILAGKPQDAQDALAVSLKLAEVTGTVQPLIAELLHIPTLRSFVEERPLTYESLLQALSQLHNTQVDPHGEAFQKNKGAAATYRLRLHTLGQVKVERDGSLLTASGWRTTSAKLVFFYLYFLGPKGREEIGVEFWPEATSEQVRRNTQMAIYYARRKLGEDTILLQDGLYLINPTIDIWCDAHQFQRLVDTACHLPARDLAAEEMWRKAVDLYRGEFLPTLESQWIQTHRTALHEDFLVALIKLGDSASARNNPQEALQAYQRVLDQDPYREPVHQRIMRVYADSGRFNMVLAHYQHMERLFREELGVPPSPESTEFINKL